MGKRPLHVKGWGGKNLREGQRFWREKAGSVGKNRKRARKKGGREGNV